MNWHTDEWQIKGKKQAKILVVRPQHQCTSACILKVFGPTKINSILPKDTPSLCCWWWSTPTNTYTQISLKFSLFCGLVTAKAVASDSWNQSEYNISSLQELEVCFPHRLNIKRGWIHYQLLISFVLCILRFWLLKCCCYQVLEGLWARSDYLWMTLWQDWNTSFFDSLLLVRLLHDKRHQCYKNWLSWADICVGMYL